MIKEYFTAFENKDIGTIERLFAERVSLQDPFIGKIEGKEEVLEVYRTMFKDNSFELDLGRSYQKGTASFAAEFSLTIVSPSNERTLIEGVDLIETELGEITSIRAYLDTSKMASESEQ